ncbi:MAG TPA: KUP/HAK/KT family potassium transporter [Candidatus Acidoferrales bacterium]|nr:KUP/HAK/KT family potassium transporter [Candidatus Acidoferrales bacterium]
MKPKPEHAGSPAALALAAVGIVFGDIGTSPLYAFRQAFLGTMRIEPTHDNVLGLLSLVLWSLILIVFVRYIGMIMRVAHDGEGGILALLAFVLPPVKRGVPPKATWLTFLIILGAGMLFGDGVITPAVSVLSSVEGLNVATTAAQPFIIPITVGVLAGLFLLQRRGSQRIGLLFGPVMVIWFVTIAALGVYGIAMHPSVLWAIDPAYIVEFFAQHGIAGIAVFGAIVLCVSGVEALYADMSHFGRKPIALAWTALVFPALALNYLGQGALVLTTPAAVQNPFYGLAPGVLLYAIVAIATAATIIASQALISGAFTLAKQAIQLGFIPRFRIVYTSAMNRGQVFVPALNTILAILCIGLVLGFRTSERLANAYGLAVSVTMVVTSIAYYVVVREKFGWSALRATIATVPFLAIELLFVAGSLPKLREGGWMPLLISLIVLVLASTWRSGRRRAAISYAEQSVPVNEFLGDVKGRLGTPYNGTAVFMTADPEDVPFVMRHHWARTHSIDERIVLLSIVPTNDPYVDEEHRVAVEHLSDNLVRVVASFGFMEKRDIAPIVSACSVRGLRLDAQDTTYYVADPVIVRAQKRPWQTWRRNLYIFLKNNSRPLTASLGIPPDQLAKLGVEVPM